MKRSLILIVLLALIAAASAYLFATDMMASLDNYRSPIDPADLPGGEPVGTPLTSRVVLVLIDGLRYDQSMDAEVMPTLAALREQGAWAKMHSRPPSYSQTGYSMIFTGAWPEWNGGPVMNIPYEDIYAWPHETIFSVVHQAGKTSATSGYYWFGSLIPQEEVRSGFNTPGEDNAADMAVMKAALPMLAENKDAFVLIHLDQGDYAGHHEGGPLSAGGKAAARRMDDMLAQVAAQLDFSTDTLMVLSDHGHVVMGGHGGTDADVLVEPFLLVGKGIQPGKYNDIQMIDVASTTAVLLGTSIPAASMGTPRTEMLTVPAETMQTLPERLLAQQTSLISAYAGAVEQTWSAPETLDVETELTHLRAPGLLMERLMRAVLGAVLLALIGLGVWNLAGKERGWMIAGALAAAGLFHLRFAVLDGMPYSLSPMTGIMDFLLYAILTQLAALLLVGGVLAGFRGWLKEGAGPAALNFMRLGISSLGLYSVIPLVFMVLYGVRAVWYLPDFGWSFAALFCCFQIIAVAVASLLLAAVAGGMGALLKKKA